MISIYPCVPLVLAIAPSNGTETRLVLPITSSANAPRLRGITLDESISATMHGLPSRSLEALAEGNGE
jgi:hypothetical protein